jgi:hypothetical protein
MAGFLVLVEALVGGSQQMRSRGPVLRADGSANAYGKTVAEALGNVAENSMSTIAAQIGRRNRKG